MLVHLYSKHSQQLSVRSLSGLIHLQNFQITTLLLVKLQVERVGQKGYLIN